jgi:hypothetical protein
MFSIRTSGSCEAKWGKHEKVVNFTMKASSTIRVSRFLIGLLLSVSVSTEL